MLHVHPRLLSAVIETLSATAVPISAESLAEQISYSVRQTYRALSALRSAGIVESEREPGYHAMRYEVDIAGARARGFIDPPSH